jgi:hypothetical protein
MYNLRRLDLTTKYQIWYGEEKRKNKTEKDLMVLCIEKKKKDAL